MKQNYLFFIIHVLLFLDYSMAYAQGSTCADPYIITDLPLNELNLSNCGMGNDYGTGGCGGSYMSGEDMVFELTTTQAACYTMLLYGISGNAGANIYVFDGCPSNNNCVDSGNAGNNDSYLQISLEANNTYYIVVGSSSSGNDCATFDIFISDPDSAPENDFCQNALSLGGLGSNYNATACDEPDSWTPDEQFGGGGGSICDGDGGWSGNHNGVWYTFTNPVLQDVGIEVFNIVCDGSVGQSLLQLGVWSNTGTCDLGEETFYNCLVTVGDAELFLNNLPAGDYYLYCDGSAASLCTWGFSSEQVITCNTPELTTLTPTLAQICTNGNTPVTFSIDTIGTQPMSVVWSQNGSPIANNTLSLTVTPNSSTIYTVAISNDCGVDTETFEVISSNLPTIAPAAPTNYSICSNSNNSYTLDVTTNGTSPITVTWTENATALAATGNSITVMPNNNTTYVATASNTCGTDTVAFHFNILPLPTATLSGGGAVCAGSGNAVPMSVALNGTPPYNLTYSINGIAQTPINAIANNTYDFTTTQLGNYALVSISDANCSGNVSGTAALTEIALPAAPILTDTLYYCQGDTLNLISINTTGSVNWYMTNPTIDPNAIISSENPLDLNEYISNIADTSTLWAIISLNGCKSPATPITIIINPIPPQATAESIIICEGESLPNLTAVGENITWYNAKPGTQNSQIINTTNTLLLPTFMNNNQVGTSVFWFDQSINNCVSPPQSVSVSVKNMPDIPLTSNIAICAGDSLLPLTAMSDGNITWYDSNLLNNAIGSGDTIWLTESAILWVVASNADTTCSTNALPVAFTIAMQDTASFSFQNYTFCLNDANPIPQINATNNGIFSADNNLIINPQSGEITLASAIAGSTYTINYTTQGICPADTQVLITVQGIVLETSPDTSIIEGTTIPIWASAQTSTGTNIDYTWQPTNSLSCTNCPNPFSSPIGTTTYNVVATDQNNCTDAANVTITVQPKPFKAIFPSAFSPNNDGINDFFGASTSQPANVTLQIYNRWGQQVFSTNSSETWNGKYQNTESEIGVYAYFATIIFANGITQNYKGNTTLIR